MPGKKQSNSFDMKERNDHSAGDPPIGSDLQIQSSAELDASILQEYHEALLLISGEHGLLNVQMSGRSMVERAVNGAKADMQTSSWQTEKILVDCQNSLTGLESPPMNFSQLAQRFSKQAQEVVITGKQITAASRQMAAGVKNLNEGIGGLQRKLSRVKY